VNKRIEKLREIMLNLQADYVVLGPNSDCFYLTSFREEQMERPLLLIISPDRVFFLAPKLYEEQISALGFDVVSYPDGSDPFSYLDLKSRKNIYLDDWLPTLHSLSIVERYSPAKVGRASQLISPLRAKKDEEEINTLREAVRLTEKLLEHVLPAIREGITELQLSNTMRREAEELGTEGMSFQPIVTSGPNTSKPHMRSTERRLRNGDPLVLDFGIRWKGYAGDMTRTFFLSQPSQEMMNVYNVVKEAQANAENYINPNVRACDVDSAARTVINKSGFGHYFIHRTGHGIGIDVHEPPYISSDNCLPLISGNVFTVEPGIYIPGKFGVRIEDMAYLLDAGGVFNSFTREMLIV